ncbi:hypothetical protein ACP70R_033065 [Stipagrostis hirtigluma subsp. patula]
MENFRDKYASLQETLKKVEAEKMMGGYSRCNNCIFPKDCHNPCLIDGKWKLNSAVRLDEHSGSFVKGDYNV